MRIPNWVGNHGVVTVPALRQMAFGAIVLVAAVGPLTVQRMEGGLRVEASLSQRTYNPGAVVEVALSVTNVSRAPVNVTFPSGQRFDLIVRRPRGDEVWRWSYDKAFIQVVQTMTLQSGESLSFRIPWDQRDFQGRPVDLGPYVAVAVLVGSSGGRGEIRLPPLQFAIGQ